MQEILRNLGRGSFVLDLGCADSSFPAEITQASVVRIDRNPPRNPAARFQFVQCDAAALPFARGTFAAIVSNHSLEHFDDLPGALREIGRVLGDVGSLFVSVPDASTLTDKLYRWLARGGGHVNAFRSAPEIVALIAAATGLRHIATRTLCSSLSFLNRRNSPRPLPLRLLPLGAGYEWSLFLYAWMSRRLDRFLGTRTSIYGWAFYFGSIEQTIDVQPWVNVCIRCGSGYPASTLQSQSLIAVNLGFRTFRCPQCGARNPYAEDYLSS